MSSVGKELDPLLFPAVDQTMQDFCQLADAQFYYAWRRSWRVGWLLAWCFCREVNFLRN